MVVHGGLTVSDSAQRLIKDLEEELEKGQAMSVTLGRAVELAKEHRVSAYDLTLCFAEACFNKNLNAARDAWFEHDLCYAEIRLANVDVTWGEL